MENGIGRTAMAGGRNTSPATSTTRAHRASGKTGMTGASGCLSRAGQEMAKAGQDMVMVTCLLKACLEKAERGLLVQGTSLPVGGEQGMGTARG